MGCPIFFPRTRDLLVSQKSEAKTLFSHPPFPFPGNFCNCNSGGICTALQFWVQHPLLYTAWSNAHSEISLEVMLQPLATSCTKDYKGHSLVQTSFTEPPNRLFPFQDFYSSLPLKSDIEALGSLARGHTESRLHITSNSFCYGPLLSMSSKQQLQFSSTIGN